MKEETSYMFQFLHNNTTTKADDKETILKTDSNFMHIIITAYEAERPVNLEQILQHEHKPVLNMA